MPEEIERKFLVRRDALPPLPAGTRIRQGYFPVTRGTVRVRLAGPRAFLTIKGPMSGIRRLEFEYEIPPEEACAMLDELCEPAQIDKTRHEVDQGGKRWEIDIFHGANAGLVMAEVELEHEDEAVEIPGWVEREVSDDPRYQNACLARNPYSTWKITRPQDSMPSSEKG